MDNLAGKHIIIGITGGIAAYKTLFLIRLFKSCNCQVRVVATQHALQFVTPLTIETLSQNKLYADLFDATEHHDVQHVSLADWGDCLIVAPATANIIGKYACGIADDALSTLLLAMSDKPVFFAPAMNDKMFIEPTVQHNLDVLRQKGCHIIEPQSGFLACGTTGTGRMEEPEKIFIIINHFFNFPQRLSGKKILVTAGPTYEPIDPVRFIGNFSSGLMGFSLAEEAAQEGAEVTLVTGPTALKTCHPHIKRVDVTTSEEMYQTCLSLANFQNIFIMSAAVADYTPAHPASEKIKKNDDNLNLQLVKTKDILATIGKIKRDDQLLVGFALETEHELENAKNKLYTKNADIIVLNSLRTQGAGFKTSTNQVTMITKDQQIIQSRLKDKKEIAKDIMNLITNTLKSN